MFDNFSKYRNLFYNLLTSDLKTRYKSSILGFLWTFIEPLLIILILVFVFSNLFKFDAKLFVPYLVTGFIVWQFFANGTSMLDLFQSKSNIIEKINFPLEIVVFSSFTSVLILSTIMLIILKIVLLFMGVNFSLMLLLLPLLIVLQSIFILGFLFFLSSVYVFVRDLRHIWNVILQAGFFATPIVYPILLLQEKVPLLLKLNPLVPFLSAYRDIMVYNVFPEFVNLAAMFLTAFISFGVGYSIFFRLKNRIRDEI